MSINKRINSFVELGEKLAHLDEETLENLQLNAQSANPWFIPESTSLALSGIKYLISDDLEGWTKTYHSNPTSKRIGVVMAGNIPGVGFHDLLCVLISGHTLLAKLSEKDTALIRFVVDTLISIDKSFEHQIHIVDQLKEMDAVIATGSDNTSRYFDYYFSKYPHIIRKNRTSVAILHGDETDADFNELATDIFSYFGLGCRNVSKLFIPKGYDLKPILHSLEKYHDLIHHHKYRNNYDYNKSIYLVNKEPHLDNGIIMFKEDMALVSPISVIFYEYYESPEDLQTRLFELDQKIQCKVSKNAFWPNSLPFGQAQYPGLRDYADGIDTMQFLSEL